MIAAADLIWPAMAAAAILGLGFAAFGGGGRGSVSAGRLAPALGLGALALAAAVALLEIVPGRPGFWLDTGVLTFGSYAGGCLLGLLLRRLVLRREAARET